MSFYKLAKIMKFKNFLKYANVLSGVEWNIFSRLQKRLISVVQSIKNRLLQLFTTSFMNSLMRTL